MTPIGNKFLALAIVIWLSYAVGPWWLGVILFVMAGILNGVEEHFLFGR